MSSFVLEKVVESYYDLVLDFEKAAECRFYHPKIFEGAFGRYVASSEIYFMNSGGNRVGTISYHKVKDNAEKNVAAIDAVTVLPEYRGKGFSGLAIGILLGVLEQNKFEEVILTVHPKNTAAIVSYLKNGFEIERWMGDVYGPEFGPRLLLSRVL